VPHPDAPVPAELAAALERAPDAGAVFAGLPPSHRWEYVRWVGEAVKPETRQPRAGKAVERLRAYAARVDPRLSAHAARVDARRAGS
jgi:uncharacterized protein YdeI (YjbR/CyaY-like superfamily)